ncbi:hypothetical protein EVAR_38618_1 [Eumeta japonica]|uniref:Uncharacterized protein n=1 Tax=Eumeta variegata TaxID=151549 RepID=A0A4C1WUD3_EUMVA|nr:hypothetical protein EVAR_38618_1 [Eumeta japonica]
MSHAPESVLRRARGDPKSNAGYIPAITPPALRRPVLAPLKIEYAIKMCGYSLSRRPSAYNEVPTPFPTPHSSSIVHPNPTREAGNALVTPLKFLVSMRSDDHLSSDLLVRLSLQISMK